MSFNVLDHFFKYLNSVYTHGGYVQSYKGFDLAAIKKVSSKNKKRKGKHCHGKR